jgi:hypothetical protein
MVYHSREGDAFHIRLDCMRGKEIDWENRLDGTGDLPPCKICAPRRGPRRLPALVDNLRRGEV